jgi:hypothetical protein
MKTEKKQQLFAAYKTTQPTKKVTSYRKLKKLLKAFN